MGNGTEDPATAGPEGLLKDAEDDDWVVECSDDETYNPCGLPGSVWEPRPEDAKALYERMSAGEVLTLEWVCHGRRSPPPEKEENEDEVKEEPEEQKQEERTLPSGFDFDEDMDAPGMKPGFTPRRTPGSGPAPRSQKKRVARMDKIMNDILRHKKIEAAERKATPGRRLQGSPGGGQRKLGALGGQRRLLSTLSDRKPPGAAGAPAQAPGTGDKSFDFDDFGMGSEISNENKPPIEASVGPVGQGAPPGQGPPHAPLMAPSDLKPVIPIVMKEPTPPPPPPATTGTLEATNIGPPPPPPPASIPLPTLPPAPAAESSAGATGKLNESLTSQMGTLSCKTEDEIKKEPEPLPATPVTAAPATVAPPPMGATNLPLTTTPAVDSSVEVKEEPVEPTAPLPTPPPAAVQTAPAPAPSPMLSAVTAPATELPSGGNETNTSQAHSEATAPAAADGSAASTLQVEKMEVDETPADSEVPKSEMPATSDIKTET